MTTVKSHQRHGALLMTTVKSHQRHAALPVVTVKFHQRHGALPKTTVKFYPQVITVRPTKTPGPSVKHARFGQ